MSILIEHIWVFLIVGLMFSATLSIVAYKRTGKLNHPFVVNAPAIGLFSCFFAIILYNQSVMAIALSFGLVLYFLSVFFGFFIIGGGSSEMRPVMSVHLSNSRLSVLLVFCYLLLLVVNFKVNILGSGISLSEIGNQRYEARMGNRFVFLASIAWRPVVIYFIAVFWGKRISWIGIITLFISWLTSFFLGSKAAILGIFLDVALIVYYREVLAPIVVLNKGISTKRGIRPRINILTWGLVALCVLFLAPFSIVWSQQGATYMSAVESLAMRLMSGFDGLFFAVEAGLVPGESSTWFGVWWLSSPLKVLGLFDSVYNGVNHYLMSYYMGALAADAGGMFPNNNFVLEAVVTSNLFFAFLSIAIIAMCYGWLAAFSLHRARLSVFWSLLFIHLTFNPYVLLIDGQGFATMTITIAPLLAIAVIMGRR